MLRKLILLVLLIGSAGLAGLPCPAQAAPDRVGKFDIGFQASGLMPQEDGVDNSLYFGGNLSYGIMSWLAVGVEGGWAQSDVEDSSAGVTIEYGDVDIMPILGDVILRFQSADNPAVPYALIGL